MAVISSSGVISKLKVLASAVDTSTRYISDNELYSIPEDLLELPNIFYDPSDENPISGRFDGTGNTVLEAFTFISAMAPLENSVGTNVWDLTDSENFRWSDSTGNDIGHAVVGLVRTFGAIAGISPDGGSHPEIVYSGGGTIATVIFTGTNNYGSSLVQRFVISGSNLNDPGSAQISSVASDGVWVDGYAYLPSTATGLQEFLADPAGYFGPTPGAPTTITEYSGGTVTLGDSSIEVGMPLGEGVEDDLSLTFSYNLPPNAVPAFTTSAGLDALLSIDYFRLIDNKVLSSSFKVGGVEVAQGTLESGPIEIGGRDLDSDSGRDGTNEYWDFSESDESVVINDDSNIIGSANNDVLLNEGLGYNISGGSGDDLLGTSFSWTNPDEGDARGTALEGGAGADTFYVIARGWDAGKIVQINDYSAEQSDQINIVTSYLSENDLITGVSVEIDPDTGDASVYAIFGDSPNPIHLALVKNAPDLVADDIVIGDALADPQHAPMVEFIDAKYQQIAQERQVEDGFSAWNYPSDEVRSSIYENVYGTRFDDVISGGDADQTIYMVGGSDYVDGSGGSDTLVLQGAFEDYAFSLRNGVYTAEVVSSNSGLESVQFKNIEFIRFANATTDTAIADLTISQLDSYGEVNTFDGSDFQELNTENDSSSTFKLITADLNWSVSISSAATTPELVYRNLSDGSDIRIDLTQVARMSADADGYDSSGTTNWGGLAVRGVSDDGSTVLLQSMQGTPIVLRIDTAAESIRSINVVDTDQQGGFYSYGSYLSGDGNFVLVNDDMGAAIYDAVTGSPEFFYAGLYASGISHDGSVIAGTDDQGVMVNEWRVNNGNGEYLPLPPMASNIKISADGTVLYFVESSYDEVTYAHSYSLNAYDIETQTLLNVSDGLSLSSDIDYSVSADGSVAVFQAESDNTPYNGQLISAKINFAGTGSVDLQLASVNAEGFDSGDLDELASLSSRTGQSTNFQLSSDGSRVVFDDQDFGSNAPFQKPEVTSTGVSLTDGVRMQFSGFNSSGSTAGSTAPGSETDPAAPGFEMSSTVDSVNSITARINISSEGLSDGDLVKIFSLDDGSSVRGVYNFSTNSFEASYFNSSGENVAEYMRAVPLDTDGNPPFIPQFNADSWVSLKLAIGVSSDYSSMIMSFGAYDEGTGSESSTFEQGLQTYTDLSSMGLTSVNANGTISVGGDGLNAVVSDVLISAGISTASVTTIDADLSAINLGTVSAGQEYFDLGSYSHDSAATSMWFSPESNYSEQAVDYVAVVDQNYDGVFVDDDYNIRYVNTTLASTGVMGSLVNGGSYASDFMSPYYKVLTLPNADKAVVWVQNVYQTVDGQLVSEGGDTMDATLKSAIFFEIINQRTGALRLNDPTDPDSADEQLMMLVDGENSVYIQNLQVQGNSFVLNYEINGVPSSMELYEGSTGKKPLDPGDANNEGVIIGSDDPEELIGLPEQAIVARLGGGSDFAVAKATGDKLFGGAGDDALVAQGLRTYLSGGEGDDQLTVYAEGIWGEGYYGLNTATDNTFDIQGYAKFGTVADGGSGSDTLVLGLGVYTGTYGAAFFLHDSFTPYTDGDTDESLIDFSQQTTRTRFEGIEKIVATSGDDIIDLSSPDFTMTGADLRIEADSGFDIILTGDSNDTIDGGDGDDYIFAGAGTNTVTGGSGMNYFGFTDLGGSTLITDFNIETDALLLFQPTAWWTTQLTDDDINSGVIAFGTSSIDLNDESINSLVDLDIRYEQDPGEQLFSSDMV